MTLSLKLAGFCALPLALALVALTASGCSGDDDDASLAAVDSLDVVDVQELDLPFGDAYLSPDGERIATYTEDELCVYDAGGERERCVDEDLELDPNSIRWDPDGTRLLFTENFYVMFLEPDIWMLDAESGDLSNLTDDGVDEGGLDLMSEDGETTADIDTVPVWVDASTVRFLRWQRAEESTVEVLEISTDGGDPEPVGTLATTTAPIDVAYTSDDRAAYGRTDEKDVALSDLAGENADSIADGMDYTVLSSSDGDLLVAPYAGSYLSATEMPPVKVVPADGGDATELEGAARWATWRSGGDGLAYATFDMKDPRQLTLRLAADAGSDGREVSTGSFLAPYRDAGWRSPVWSTQDTILLMQEDEDSDDEAGDEQPFQYVLVHLGEG